MPDLRLGLLDAGEGITQEGIDMWNELSFSFFSSTAAKNDAKAKKAMAKPKNEASLQGPGQGSHQRKQNQGSKEELLPIPQNHRLLVGAYSGFWTGRLLQGQPGATVAEALASPPHR